MVGNLVCRYMLLVLNCLLSFLVLKVGRVVCRVFRFLKLVSSCNWVIVIRGRWGVVCRYLVVVLL